MFKATWRTDPISGRPRGSPAVIALDDGVTIGVTRDGSLEISKPGRAYRIGGGKGWVIPAGIKEHVDRGASGQKEVLTSAFLWRLNDAIFESDHYGIPLRISVYDMLELYEELKPIWERKGLET